MASAFGSLWAISCGDGALAKIDGKAGKVTATLQRGASDDTPGAIVATDDSIWMMLDDNATIARVDPDQMMIVDTMRLPAGCRSMVSAEKSLWIACPEENKVYRINPDTNLVDKRIETGPEPSALAFGEGSIWAFCRKEGKLDRIDPKTNKVTKTIDLGAREPPPDRRRRGLRVAHHDRLSPHPHRSQRPVSRPAILGNRRWRNRHQPRRHLALEHQRRKRPAHRPQPDQSHVGGVNS